MAEMISRKELIEKYWKLSRPDREAVGEALVKVNLGVSSPEELRRVASFLKGSEFIAKAETLDRLIVFLHEDPDAPSKKIRERTEALPKEAWNTTAAENLKIHPEDIVVTTKGKVK
ncbi:MAG: hypothetical protein Q7T11_10060 [Deltaproteobacteria bacterium]|nr:hypothetical protein [Deltaproteobacteria bacterium]